MNDLIKGYEIKEKRKAMGWTQTQLANKMFSTKMTVYNHENGHTIPLNIQKQYIQVFSQREDDYGVILKRLDKIESRLELILKTLNMQVYQLKTAN